MAKNKAKTLNTEDWLKILDWTASMKRGSLTAEQYEELAALIRALEQ